ncbi:uncharacterized protein AB675_5244 [Cyphellophora attinorum]|uniref:Arrestin-like N-terminal domain-containing protein n=1 Tax=Cyphellophora attinorum TaxID=1664694 RepID=A0A0N1HNZ6_9EURO|nr:uncharacterized protein AB675_5244 [Phialophora attinorum]KPI39356.1 hypothetical protein AB675_5244 [Phialophora attinorum]
MPRTGPSKSNGLTISLDDFQPTYQPGDVLIGRVTLSNAPLQSSSVRLKFFGRAKTKYTVKTSNGTSIERGRAGFFEVAQHLTTETVAADGSRSFPFSVTVPTSSQPNMSSRGDEFKHHSDYLSTLDVAKKTVDVTKHPLPSVMYYHAKSEMSGKTSEAYVEYGLHASVAGKEATLPIFIRQKSSAVPILDHHMMYRSILQTLQTPRLLAEHADKELTFRQKSSRFFKRSKTPKYVFQVRIETPSTVQLEHPNAVPIKIGIVPDLHSTRTTISLDALPPVYLSQFKLQLELCVDIRCPGTFWDSENDKHHDIDIPILFPQRMLIPTLAPEGDGKPLTSSWGLQAVPTTTTANGLSPQVTTNGPADARTTRSASFASQATTLPPLPSLATSSNTPLDIGNTLSIFIGTSACTTRHSKPHPFKRQLYPSFKTYNIHLYYKLKWKATISCAGEVEELSGTSPLTILAPSEQQEEQKMRELGIEGMKKNYDDLMAGLESGFSILEGILQVVGSV